MLLALEADLSGSYLVSIKYTVVREEHKLGSEIMASDSNLVVGSVPNYYFLLYVLSRTNKDKIL
jgi:hypothetical protein